MTVTLIKAAAGLAAACCLLVQQTLSAQCISSGPLSPGTVTNVSVGGSVSFSNLTGILASDNNRTSAAPLLSLLTGSTNQLKATGFGFNIPLSAIICGIQVEVEKSAANIGSVLLLESYVTDDEVALVKNGVTLSGINKATATHWTGSDHYYTYGSDNDLWGTAWLPADINAADFGIAFAARFNGLITLIPTARIDHIRITVFYLDILLPLQLKDFTVTEQPGEQLLLQWETAGPEESSRFSIQQSQDGLHWTTRHDIAVETITGTNRYRATDKTPPAGQCWYRIQMISASGKTMYSSTKTGKTTNITTISVYPNPFTSSIQINGIPPGETVFLVDTYGRPVTLPAPETGHNQLRLDLTGLRPGIYFIRAGHQKIKILKK